MLNFMAIVYINCLLLDNPSLLLYIFIYSQRPGTSHLEATTKPPIGKTIMPDGLNTSVLDRNLKQPTSKPKETEKPKDSEKPIKSDKAIHDKVVNKIPQISDHQKLDETDEPIVEHIGVEVNSEAGHKRQDMKNIILMRYFPYLLSGNVHFCIYEPLHVISNNVAF